MKARDLAALEEFEETTHLSNLTGITDDTDPTTLFSSNASCILTPEVTEGPYFVTGEYIRSDVVETQDGVPLHMEFQFIDTSTCEPVDGLMIDVWHANATGVYSGVIVSGNGDGSEDPTNIVRGPSRLLPHCIGWLTLPQDKTFLRGLQPTDSEGVAAFDSIFPGHYQGRATHFHVIAHINGTVLPNATYSGGSITHVGQLFWDESLRALVEAVEPYASNTQAILSNDDDMWAPAQADNDYDPFPDYVLVGDTVADGLIAWISIGIDVSSDCSVDVAAELTADGGVVEDGSLDTSSGNGNGTFIGNGTTASGGFGSAPTGTGMYSNGTSNGTTNGTTASTTTSTSSVSTTSVLDTYVDAQVGSGYITSSTSQFISTSSSPASVQIGKKQGKKETVTITETERFTMTMVRKEYSAGCSASK